jgi:hypothetical protein
MWSLGLRDLIKRHSYLGALMPMRSSAFRPPLSAGRW